MIDRDPREPKKPADGGPILKRDTNNVLDQNDAKEQAEKLMRELITTQRDIQKDLSFRNVKTSRRDIIVKTIIMQRNTVNGKIVADDYKNPVFEKLTNDPRDMFLYNTVDYVDGEIMVREMPMGVSNVTRWTMGMYKAVINYLAKMNIMDRI